MSPLKCPGQDPRFLKAQDIAEVKCPQCSRPVEFWPDELMRKCPRCGRRFANPEASLKCLQWCEYAAQCLAAIRGADASALGPVRDELIERMRKVFEHDLDRVKHTMAVLELAEEIGRREGVEHAVLVPAAILHDIGQADPQGDDHLAAEILTELGIPAAVRDEILDLVAHHHERDRMATRNGAPLFDAGLIVNLRAKGDPDGGAILARQALTESGRQIGLTELSR